VPIAQQDESGYMVPESPFLTADNSACQRGTIMKPLATTETELWSRVRHRIYNFAVEGLAGVDQQLYNWQVKDRSFKCTDISKLS
jgi:hypothetical protein